MIYFIQEDREPGYIKIGYAKTNIEKCISTMQRGNPSRLICRAVIEGDRRDETRLHKRFRKWRVSIGYQKRSGRPWVLGHYAERGEWFEAADELMKLIATLPSYPPPPLPQPDLDSLADAMPIHRYRSKRNEIDKKET